MSSKYHNSEIPASPTVAKVFAAPSPSSSSWSGTLSPSGKLRIGYVPPKKILKADTEYESTRQKFTFFVRSHWHWDDGLVREYSCRVEKPSELGLASVPNYHKPPVRRYGLKGISSAGRSKIREGAYLLQRHYGRRLGFYTLTCPYTDAESIYSYNKNISYIQRSYFQEIKRVYERLNVTFSYVSVLEIQESRFARTGEPVLHIHYLANCYIPGTHSFCITATEMRNIWGRVLGNCLPSRVCTSSSIDAAIVKSSAVGYISKYMSKGGSQYEFLANTAPSQIPSRWWGMSCKVRRAIANYTVSVPSEICDYFMRGAGCTSASFFTLRYYRFLDICVQGRHLCVGLSADMAECSADILRPPDFFSSLGKELLTTS